MDSVVALIAFAVVGFAAAFSILPLQSRRERQDRDKVPEQEWAESGFAMSRGEFELCRVMPTPKMTVAEYVFQDETRREFGRYTTITRFRGLITFGSRTATLYIQGSGINRSKFAGDVGGTSNSSIVIRDENQVLAEIFRRVEGGAFLWDMRCSGRTLTIRSPRWAMFNRGTVFELERQAGEYRRSPGVSRRILVALDRKLPDDLRAFLCSLTLLQ